MTSCCDFIEPCHADECSGLDEVAALLPSGRLWKIDDDRLMSRYFKAIGHVKSDFNALLCQLWAENNPCTADRMFDYWAQVYAFPSCVEQTNEKLCEWIELVDFGCPKGSLGFLKQAVEFVAPGKNIQIELSFPDLGECCPKADECDPEKNQLLITAPPECFYFDDRQGEDIDDFAGDDGCSGGVYFIPEIECLRCTVFPFGVSVGVQTNPTGPNGEQFHNVPPENLAEKPASCVITPNSDCKDNCK